MNYNEQNGHYRDRNVNFDSELHVYNINGVEHKSVTTLVEDCFEQFDADYWSRKKAPSLGMTPQEVKTMWKRKGDEARNLGKQMHEKIERYYMGMPNTLDETYSLFCQFAQQYDLKPYRTEWSIYDENNKIAGTLDFLDFSDGKFTIYDWKRSNKVIVGGLPDKVSRWGKHALYPISHVHDTSFWHYSLQMSFYRYILENNYEIKVSACRLVILHPDYNCPYVVDVPYMKDEIISILNN